MSDIDADTKKSVSDLIDDPDEFMRLLDQFGKEAMAKAEINGRNKAVAEMLKIIVKSRIPGTTKEWLQNQCRELANPPL